MFSWYLPMLLYCASVTLVYWSLWTMLRWSLSTSRFSKPMVCTVRSFSTVMLWSCPTLVESSASTEVDMLRSAWMLTSSSPFLSSNINSL